MFETGYHRAYAMKTVMKKRCNGEIRSVQSVGEGTSRRTNRVIFHPFAEGEGRQRDSRRGRRLLELTNVVLASMERAVECDLSEVGRPDQGRS